MTSISSSTTGSSVLRGAASDRAAAPPRKSARGMLWAGLSVIGVSIVGGLSWAAWGWSSSAMELAGGDRHLVAARNFSVVLKEKGELKAAKSTEIMSRVEGRATIISLVSEGAYVKEGDLLVQLASDQIENRIRQDELKEANAITAFESARTELDIQRDQNASDIRRAELRIELNSLELEKYEKGDWVQRHKDATIAIEQAQINLERRKEDFKAAKKLLERDFITRTEYEEDEFNHQKAVWELEKALKAREVLEKYTHVAALRQRQSDLEEAIKEAERIRKNASAVEAKRIGALVGKRKELALIQDQLAKLRRQQENCTITAPTQGFVVYYAGGGGRHWMSSDSQIREGATVHERQILLTLPDTSQMIVVVRVHEAKTDKLHLDQRVTIKVEGLPGKTFTGRVTKIAVVADSQNRWLNPDLKEYETEITLDQSDDSLKPGVTAHAEILVESIENKLAVPVQTVYTKNGGRYVFQALGRKVVPTKVQVGAIGTEWAEITDGLSGGESILLAFNDDHKRLVPDAPAGQWGRSMGRPSAGAGSHPPQQRQPPSHAQKGGAEQRAGHVKGMGGGDAHRPQRPKNHAGQP